MSTIANGAFVNTPANECRRIRIDFQRVIHTQLRAVGSKFPLPQIVVRFVCHYQSAIQGQRFGGEGSVRGPASDVALRARLCLRVTLTQY